MIQEEISWPLTAFHVMSHKTQRWCTGFGRPASYSNANAKKSQIKSPHAIACK